MKSIIEVRNVTKIYGSQKVLDHVSIDFEEKSIHGLIGRNGSGKTMLMKAILGFIRCDEGEIFIRGKQVGKDFDFPENAGMMIERPGFLPQENARRNLRMLAKIRGKIGKTEIDQAIRLLGLDPASKKKVAAYSLGMRQRLGIAQALMEDPEILILDEPFSGLDAEGLKEMRQLFLSLKDRGKTILIASHNTEDIAMLCDTVHRMEAGKIFPVAEDQGKT